MSAGARRFSDEDLHALAGSHECGSTWKGTPEAPTLEKCTTCALIEEIRRARRAEEPAREAPPEFYDVAGAARELRVTRGRVHQLIRKGVLRASRLTPRGRYIIPREWLLEAVLSREVAPKPASSLAG